MPISRPDTPHQANGLTGTSGTVQHTCSGSNRIVFAAVEAGGAQPTGVTYDTVSMTQINVQVQGGHHWSLWYLLNPNTTSNANCKASFSGSQSYIDIMVASYAGVNQSMTYGGGSPTDVNVVGSGGSPYTSNFTTIKDNSWAILYGADTTSGTAPTASTGSVFLITTSDGTSLYDTNAALTPAGGWGMTLTFSSTIYTIVASFSPAAADPALESMPPVSQPTSHWIPQLSM
ncbi:MAG TPA: hypothetical protein VLC46_26870 [Thermoanaerobaculia bacterium]|jgi:hypothetical protein|nr:hypothetical protein [Thermoanaerobaculia bacterium]